ncbi:MAG: thioesterase family protein [Actinobacteria bacterium]|nr:thioesterase family protein [Actinomycetota bacterium]
MSTTEGGDAAALFVPDGDAVYVATHLTQGPWNPEHQHGGPVSALLAHVVEQVPTLVPMRCGRLAIDLMRAVPVARLETAARIVREGKRVQVVEAVLEHDGVVVARASALRVRISDTASALTHPRRPDESPPPPPTQVEESVLAKAGLPVPGFLLALDMHRVTGGLGLGAPACTWFRLRQPVVAGVDPSPLVRLAALADFTSGTANFLPIDKWSSINADISINVLREPIGDWIAVDAVAHVAGDGIGHSRATLYDTTGMVGTGSTVQLVDPVATPFAAASKLARDVTGELA